MLPLSLFPEMEILFKPVLKIQEGRLPVN
uniref:Uncharacterized protein n=1 Tax=Rhizophora mucronata TaxID=61149 RepID=A0A2P2J1V8_RHIMU